LAGKSLTAKTMETLREDGVKATLVRTKDFFKRKVIKEPAPPLAERLGFINDVDLTIGRPVAKFAELDGNLKIVWVVPPMGIGSGGHMTIFRMVHYLEEFGHTCQIAIFGKTYDEAEEIKEMINSHFIRVRGDVITDVDQIGECDALIATSWETAYPVYRNATARNKYYFVQDYEPVFHPTSSYSHFAEQTYSFGFNHITAGPWLAKLIEEKYGGKAQSFNLAYDKHTYFPRDGVERDACTVAIYARPVTPRRGFELAVLAMSLVKDKRPDARIVFFGWDELGDLPFEATNLGILDHRSLADLYRRATIGLVISFTNYSLIPQEMMACKLPVVDIRGDNTTSIFGSDNEKIFLADPTPHHIAAAVLDLLENGDRRAAQAENAYSYVKGFSWEEEARKVERMLWGKGPGEG
jgi:glycosyltransferase involved in cell wall biosynthesis